MASTPKGKSKKKQDAFADDLEAMLNGGNGEATQTPQVQAIEDDETIDRLLMTDHVRLGEADPADDNFDIDQLIAEEFSDKNKNSDFDAVLADLPIIPNRQPQPLLEEFDEFDELLDTDIESQKVQSIEDVTTPELSALERVEDIDEFADQTNDNIDFADAISDIQLESGAMAEIDEFSDETPPIKTDNRNDFLMEDFDISSDDDMPVSPPPAEQLIEALEKNVSDFEPVPIFVESEPLAADKVVAETIEEPLPASAFDSREEDIPPIEAQAISPEAEKAVPVTSIDHSEELADLNKQITVLKKQLQVIKQEITEKAGKDLLATSVNDIESLQTEQKKTKRAVDTLGNKKPVLAYTAVGLSVAALMIGSGLGFQGFIAKSQVGELTQITAKLQEQVNTGPASDAADKEMTRKQLDELSVAGSVAASQIAEIKKALQSDSGSGKPVGDVSKQIADLSSQNMQMGAAIEALENNLKALQKSRPVAAVAPAIAKPEKKAPAVIVENWAVNLIAFKQDWYAKRKAEEFAAKGVPAQVSKSELKGENWYRLSVDGFKSQYEAAGYAAKVKKSLNLDSVWVARVSGR